METWADLMVEENRGRRALLWEVWAEYETCQWVEHVDMTKGVGPSSVMVHAYFASRLRAAPGLVQERVLPYRTRNAKLLWAVRWRRRWHATIGRLPLGDVDPPETLLQKAGMGTFFV